MNIRLLLRTGRRDLIKTKYILGGKNKWRCAETVPACYRLLEVWPLDVSDFRSTALSFDGLSRIYIFLNSGFVGFELRPLLINTAAAASSLYVPSILYRLQ